MTQDTKCFWGLHKYEILEQVDIIDKEHKDKIGVNIISRCTNCGKIKTTFIPTDSNYINRSTRS